MEKLDRIEALKLLKGLYSLSMKIEDQKKRAVILNAIETITQELL